MMDWKIRITDIIQIVILLGVGILAFTHLQSRVNVNEVASMDHEKADAVFQKNTKDWQSEHLAYDGAVLQDLKTDIKDIRKSMTDIALNMRRWDEEHSTPRQKQRESFHGRYRLDPRPFTDSRADSDPDSSQNRDEN